MAIYKALINFCQRVLSALLFDCNFLRISIHACIAFQVSTYVYLVMISSAVLSFQISPPCEANLTFAKISPHFLGILLMPFYRHCQVVFLGMA